MPRPPANGVAAAGAPHRYQREPPASRSARIEDFRLKLDGDDSAPPSDGESPSPSPSTPPGGAANTGAKYVPLSERASMFRNRPTSPPSSSGDDARRDNVSPPPIIVATDARPRSVSSTFSCYAAQAHCGSCVCVVQHRPTVVGGAHNSPVANATMILKSGLVQCRIL